MRLLHPKDSSKTQLLEAKRNMRRMLASLPLTDDEQAAVDDGHAALDHLLSRLADVPTPAGPTPRQIGAPAAATLLPIVDAEHGPTVQRPVVGGPWQTWPIPEQEGQR